MRWLAPAAVLLAATLVAITALWADLKPQVDDKFFFAPNSTAYLEAQSIRKKFRGQELLVVTAHAPSIETPQYRDEVARLTQRLEALKRVHNVTSLAEGPKNLQDARDSPLWKRLILLPDANATNLLLAVDNRDASALVNDVMGVMRASENENFRLTLAGVPYVVDDIAKNLQADFGAFSIAAIVVFGVLATLLFRSWAVLLGSMTACTVAALATLLIQQLAGGHIGMLTANLITIAFVLTQSHIVFMTNNWRQSGNVPDALRRTLKASVWCMVAALLGFMSLWYVEAQPLRELGYGGALATACAIASAYLLYPPFLLWAKPRPAIAAARGWGLPHRAASATILVAALGCSIGIGFVNSDPSLLDYFDDESPVWRSLASVDPHGGSNPLSLIVRRADNARLDTDDAYEQMWALQRALQDDPAVGTVVSLPVLLAEAASKPFASLLSWNWLLKILEKPRFERVAQGFITADHGQTQYLLRMYEGGRTERRTDVIARLKLLAEKRGWETVAAGGTYALQGRLADVVYASLYEGLAGLLAAIALIGFIVTRSLRASVAMLLCTATVPAVTLGSFGAFSIPLDIIATPGVNVALGVAVDSMIHLGAAWRRHGDAPDGLIRAQREQAAGILAFSIVVICGFAIFAISSFPPTRRFGLAVIIGSATAGIMALWVLPGLLRPKTSRGAAAGMG